MNSCLRLDFVSDYLMSIVLVPMFQSCIGFHPVSQLGQRPSTVGDLVLFHLRHFGIGLALMLEASVPTWPCQSLVNQGRGVYTDQSQWVLVPRRFCPISRSARVERQWGYDTHSCTSLKDDNFMAWTFAVPERTHSLSTLVLETREQLVEVLYSHRLEEPLAMIQSAAGWGQG